MHPLPVTERVPLHSNILYELFALVFGGENNMHPLSGGGGGTNGKVLKSFEILRLTS